MAIAKQAGMSEQTFNACLSDQKMLDAMQAEQKRATDKFGVNSTPTLFVNGKKRGRRRVDRGHGQDHRRASAQDLIFRDLKSSAYSDLMPAVFTTSGQRCNSLLMKASNCCAVPPTMSAACCSVIAERTAGACRT